MADILLGLWPLVHLFCSLWIGLYLSFGYHLLTIISVSLVYVFWFGTCNRWNLGSVYVVFELVVMIHYCNSFMVWWSIKTHMMMSHISWALACDFLGVLNNSHNSWFHRWCSNKFINILHSFYTDGLPMKYYTYIQRWHSDDILMIHYTPMVFWDSDVSYITWSSIGLLFMHEINCLSIHGYMHYYVTLI